MVKSIPRPWTEEQRPARLEDLCAFLETLAPLAAAEPWDKVGLLAAPPADLARRGVAEILVALDLTPPVRDQAIKLGTDLLVCYHPPLFEPIERLRCDRQTPSALAVELAYHGLAIYSPHTALDVAQGGTNDALARQLGLRPGGSLKPLVGARHVKLAVFVPEAHVEKVATAVFDAGAGRIGKNSRYRHCSFRTKGTGTFFGDASTRPAVGRKGRLEYVAEVRLETVVPISCLEAVVTALKKAHPYEEPAFDLLAMEALPEEPGLGRLAKLPKPMELAALAKRCAGALGLPQVQMVGPARRRIATVAILAGSAGRWPIEAARRHPFDALITGELKHHDMIALQAAELTAICLGHGPSEQPVLRVLARRLAEKFPAVRVRLSRPGVTPYEWVAGEPRCGA